MTHRGRVYRSKKLRIKRATVAIIITAIVILILYTIATVTHLT